MNDENLEALCQQCGETLSNFLHQMEQHNAEVVCPSCGKTQEKASSHPGTEKASMGLSEAQNPSPVPAKKRSKGTGRPRSTVKP